MKTKKIVIFFMVIVTVFSLSSCAKNSTVEEETETVQFDSAEDAFEAMTGAADEGDYGAAVKYYNSGAADASDPELLNWYYYTKAADEYSKNGCLGYPLDLLQNKVDSEFEQSKETMNTIKNMVWGFNGTFTSGNTYFLYIADGKIVASEGVELSGKIICTDELVVKDDVYYWATHKEGGVDELLYTIEMTNDGITVTAVKDNPDGIYSGSYVTFDAEMPELYY